MCHIEINRVVKHDKPGNEQSIAIAEEQPAQIQPQNQGLSNGRR